MDKLKQRDFGADCVRVMAICLLFWLHFYLRNGFYYSDVHNVPGYIATAFVPIFLTCVPLFAILTGYLKCNKEWNKRYYLSIIPILLSWLIISLIHLLYKALYLHENKSALEWFTELVTYKLADYSWYIGMYLGLFLLAPLLNAAWRGCKNRNQHRMLLVSMFLVCSLPQFVQGLCGIRVLPMYFTQTSYLLYYLIGCYIVTYKPKPHPALLIGIVILVAVILDVANLTTRTEINNFYKGYSIEYSHPATYILSTCLFLLAYRAQSDSRVIRGIAMTIANVTLEMYLISYIFDSNIYTRYDRSLGHVMYIPVGLLMTAAVFSLSFLSGWLVHTFSTSIGKAITSLVTKEN